MIVFLSSHGVKPVFIVELSGSHSARNRYLVSYSKAGASVAAESGALVVDPSPIVERYAGDPRDLFYFTGVHFAAEGSKRFAEFIFTEVFGPAG